MRFTLYPIYGLSTPWDEEAFDHNTSPFPITEDVQLEDVGCKFRDGAFALWQPMIGTSTLERLEDVRYALVNGYDPAPIIQNDAVINQEAHSGVSREKLNKLAACLRLIRPMRQRAMMMRGTVRDEDGTFEVTGSTCQLLSMRSRTCRSSFTFGTGMLPL